MTVAGLLVPVCTGAELAEDQSATTTPELEAEVEARLVSHSAVTRLDDHFFKIKESMNLSLLKRVLALLVFLGPVGFLSAQTPLDAADPSVRELADHPDLSNALQESGALVPAVDPIFPSGLGFFLDCTKLNEAKDALEAFSMDLIRQHYDLFFKRQRIRQRLLNGEESVELIFELEELNLTIELMEYEMVYRDVDLGIVCDLIAAAGC